ncbi:hypothetical protein [Vibrio astriarenae]|uniref:hypothetical protein n=1 Tax=Vibrio astriarenae TaxID=1481923 RepID=UPI003736BE74
MEDSRTYIHFSEIEKRTSLNAEQVIDAIYDGKINVYCFVREQDLGLVVNDTLLGLFDYQGMVLLPVKLAITLACDNKDVELSELHIVEPTAIKFIHDIRTRFNGLPSRVFKAYDYDGEVPDKPFIAVGRIVESSDFGAELLTVSEEMKASKPTSFEEYLSGIKSILSTDRKLVKVSPIGLKPCNIRLESQELSQLFKLGATESKPVNLRYSNQSSQGLKPEITVNPLECIIERVLSEYPKATSREAWNAIRAKYRLEQGEYDVDSIIHDMSDEKIYYKNGSDEGLSYRSFQNLISRARKKVHC